MGNEAAVDLPGFAASDSFERFRAKTRVFLKEHEDHLTLHKLRLNDALTSRTWTSWSGCSSKAASALCRTVSGPGSRARARALVRSLVGLDREGAKQGRSKGT